MQFFHKFCKFVCWRPPPGWLAPHFLWGILDPPLVLVNIINSSSSSSIQNILPIKELSLSKSSDRGASVLLQRGRKGEKFSSPGLHYLLMIYFPYRSKLFCWLRILVSPGKSSDCATQRPSHCAGHWSVVCYCHGVWLTTVTGRGEKFTSPDLYNTCHNHLKYFVATSSAENTKLFRLDCTFMI